MASHTTTALPASPPALRDSHSAFTPLVPVDTRCTTLLDGMTPLSLIMGITVTRTLPGASVSHTHLPLTLSPPTHGAGTRELSVTCQAGAGYTFTASFAVTVTYTPLSLFSFIPHTFIYLASPGERALSPHHCVPHSCPSCLGGSSPSVYTHTYIHTLPLMVGPCLSPLTHAGLHAHSMVPRCLPPLWHSLSYDCHTHLHTLGSLPASLCTASHGLPSHLSVSLTTLNPCMSSHGGGSLYFRRDVPLFTHTRCIPLLACLLSHMARHSSLGDMA